MDNSYDYEHKLYSLKILNEAQKLHLISREQYISKQNEFLHSIHFNIEAEEDSAHAAELLRDYNSRSYEEEYQPHVAKPRKRTTKLTHTDDEEERKQRSRPKQQEEGEHNEEDDAEELLHKMTKSLSSPDDGEGKHKTFSEFIFAGLKHLGGAAELQELYQYVFDHKEDIDPRFSYRFKTGDYKSNVRSTLHNTGSFHKNNNGKWTIDSPLKGRGGRV